MADSTRDRPQAASADMAHTQHPHGQHGQHGQHHGHGGHEGQNPNPGQNPGQGEGGTPVPQPGTGTPAAATTANGRAPVAKPVSAAAKKYLTEPAPSEDEIRKAREVLNRAKAHGVKVSATHSGGGQARIMLSNGETRNGYIKRRWEEGADRSQILAEVQSDAGQEGCTYQIVFSATKDITGGPKNKAPGANNSAKLMPKPAGTVSTNQGNTNSTRPDNTTPQNQAQTTSAGVSPAAGTPAPGAPAA